MPPIRNILNDRSHPYDCQPEKRTTSKKKKPDLGNKLADHFVDAAIERLIRLENGPIHLADQDLVPIPPEVLQRMTERTIGKSEINGQPSESLLDDIRDLSPDPDAPKQQPRHPPKVQKPQHNFDERGNPTKHALKRLTKEMYKMYCYSSINRTKLKHINFKELVKKKKVIERPTTLTTFDGSVPRSVISNDGELLVVYYPNAVSSSANDALSGEILKELSVNPPKEFATRVSQGKPRVYKCVPNQWNGEVRMIRYLHALGRKKSKDLVLSSDFLKSGKRFVGQCKTLRNLQLLAHRVNELLRHNDPIHYQHACNLRDYMERTFPFTRTMGTIDTLVYEGRELLLNVQSPEHTDRQDPKRAWALLAALGYHRGGYMILPELGLRIRLEPGDLLGIRGRVFKHFVEDWTGGQRICVPHFTHSTIWRLAKMAHLVGLEPLPVDTEDEEEWEDEEWEDEDSEN